MLTPFGSTRIRSRLWCQKRRNSSKQYCETGRSASNAPKRCKTGTPPTLTWTMRILTTPFPVSHCGGRALHILYETIYFTWWGSSPHRLNTANCFREGHLRQTPCRLVYSLASGRESTVNVLSWITSFARTSPPKCEKIRCTEQRRLPILQNGAQCPHGALCKGPGKKDGLKSTPSLPDTERPISTAACRRLVPETRQRVRRSLSTNNRCYSR